MALEGKKGTMKGVVGVQLPPLLWIRHLHQTHCLQARPLTAAAAAAAAAARAEASAVATVTMTFGKKGGVVHVEAAENGVIDVRTDVAAVVVVAKGAEDIMTVIVRLLLQMIASALKVIVMAVDPHLPLRYQNQGSRAIVGGKEAALNIPAKRIL